MRDLHFFWLGLGFTLAFLPSPVFLSRHPVLALACILSVADPFFFLFLIASRLGFRLPSISRTCAASRQALLHAVDAFWLESNDVLVFRKIFCHELDEKFPRVQSHLKQTAQDLLKALIKRQNMLKPDASIHTLTAKKVKGHLLAIEWQDIIKFLYPDEADRDHITAIVRKMLAAQQAALGSAPNAAMQSLLARSGLSASGGGINGLSGLSGIGTGSGLGTAVLDPSLTMFALPTSLTQQTVAAVSRRLAAQQAESIRYADFLEVRCLDDRARALSCGFC